MTHGQHLVEILLHEGAHSNCLQTLFSEKAERRAAKWHIGAKRRRRSSKPRELKHQEDDMLKMVKERSPGAVLGSGGPSTAAGLASLCVCGGELGER